MNLGAASVVLGLLVLACAVPILAVPILGGLIWLAGGFRK
jgi:hypothetical protein